MLSTGPVEAVLLAAAAAGAWWAYRNAREAERDFHAVKGSGQNGLLLLTAAAMRAQQRAWGVVVGLVLIILLAGLPQPSPWQRPIHRIASMGILVAVVVGSGRADRHRRQLVDHVIEAERQAREQHRRSTDV